MRLTPAGLLRESARLSHAEEYLHDDIVINQSGAEAVRGIAANRAMMEAQYGAFPDWPVALDDQFATDDRVACRWRVNGTHSGDGLGFPATGRHVEYAGVSVWEFEDGKARRGWIFADVPSLIAQVTEPAND